MSTRSTATFRDLFVEPGLFTPRVVLKDLFFGVIRQGFIRLHVLFVPAWNGRHAALIGLPFAGIRSRSVWQRNRLKIHLRRAWPCNGLRHRLVGFGLVDLGGFHVSAPFQLEDELDAVGKVPYAEAF